MKRTRYTSSNPNEGHLGAVRARRIGERVLIRGVSPVSARGKPVAIDDPYGQTWRCIQLLEEALEAFDGVLADVVSTRIYLVQRDDWSVVARAHADAFDEIKPVTTMVVVKGLLDPLWRVEMEAEAILPRARPTPPMG